MRGGGSGRPVGKPYIALNHGRKPYKTFVPRTGPNEADVQSHFEKLNSSIQPGKLVASQNTKASCVGVTDLVVASPTVRPHPPQHPMRTSNITFISRLPPPQPTKNNRSLPPKADNTHAQT